MIPNTALEKELEEKARGLGWTLTKAPRNDRRAGRYMLQNERGELVALPKPPKDSPFQLTLDDVRRILEDRANKVEDEG